MAGSLAERNQKKIIFSPWSPGASEAMPVAGEMLGANHVEFIGFRKVGAAVWLAHGQRSNGFHPAAGAGGFQRQRFRPEPPLSQFVRSSVPRSWFRRRCCVAAVPFTEQGRRHLIRLPRGGRNSE